VLRSHVACHVLVDFDGTIANVDTIDALLERFALPEWQTIESEWVAGAIGSRECLVRQIDLVRATPEVMDAFIASIRIDPDAAAFIELCGIRGVEVTVASDGFDRTVAAVLSANGIKAKIRANGLRHAGGDRWKLVFPHAREDCQNLAGNCKCATPDAAKAALRVVVGDGRSDYCVAESADYILAKDKLAEHAKAKQLPHDVFADFAEASRKFSAWLDQVQTQRQLSRPSGLPGNDRAVD
jgi:2-hydroxy-3-keto-5-methylthiopentenyl-1-phosphate phosphatase